ncbi:MAG: hypothetical protein KGZ58_00495 [Ignavibacteriales bacterium]|nr:hypothetical protein [Ignavibacteriales bacterium]
MDDFSIREFLTKLFNDEEGNEIERVSKNIACPTLPPEVYKAGFRKKISEDADKTLPENTDNKLYKILKHYENELKENHLNIIDFKEEGFIYETITSAILCLLLEISNNGSITAVKDLQDDLEKSLTLLSKLPRKKRMENAVNEIQFLENERVDILETIGLLFEKQVDKRERVVDAIRRIKQREQELKDNFQRINYFLKIYGELLSKKTQRQKYTKFIQHHIAFCILYFEAIIEEHKTRFPKVNIILPFPSSRDKKGSGTEKSFKNNGKLPSRCNNIKLFNGEWARRIIRLRK